MSLARRTGRVRALALALGLAAAAASSRAGEAPDPLASLPGELHTVASLGHWAAGARFGAYRVVVLKGGVDRPVTRLVVQWLSDAGGSEAGVPVVEASRDVAAVAAYAGARVLPAWRARGNNRLEVSARIRTPDGRWRRVVVLATTPGSLIEVR